MNRFLAASALTFAFLLVTPTASFAQQPEPQTGFVVDLDRMTAAEGDVADGEVLFSMPARYLRTGRLENEMRSNPRPWAQNNIVPAGSPMFAAQFDRLGVLWCAVAPWNDHLSSVCFQDIRGGTGRAHLGAAYAPPALAPDFFMQEAARVTEDPTAEFPPMEMVYVLDRWDRRGVRIWRGLRVNGVIYRIGRFSLNRSDDGTASMNISGHAVRMTQVGEDGARAELLAR